MKRRSDVQFANINPQNVYIGGKRGFKGNGAKKLKVIEPG